jgi:hypothetical protein
MSNQPGYGHIRSGDITGWARGRSSFVRPRVDDKPTHIKTPVTSLKKLRAVKVESVLYPERADITAPIDTKPDYPPGDEMDRVNRVHAITAVVNARLSKQDPVEATLPYVPVFSEQAAEYAAIN